MRHLNLLRKPRGGGRPGWQGSTPTAAEKIIHVNRKFGNDGIQKQQGTTRILYDMLPLDGSTEFRFFEGASQRSFPFTNVGSFGNKLDVGESITVQRAYFAVATQDAIVPEEITAIIDLTTAALDGLYASQLKLEISTSTTLKPIPLSSFKDDFNKDAMHDDYSVFTFDTNLVIPPLLEFLWLLRTPPYTPLANAQLMFVFEGLGTLLSPRANF